MRAFIIFYFGLFAGCLLAQSQNPKGQFAVGFRQIYLENSETEQVSHPLILNLWYPTLDTLNHQIPISTFAYNYLPGDMEITDSLKWSKLNELKETLIKWYGGFEEERWESFINANSNAHQDAPYHPHRFPSIIGRLRAFSTTLINEMLASNGYMVCMLTPVEDYPPSNELDYLRQVDNEIRHFEYARRYLNQVIGISSKESALMGFSGNGVSPFLGGMISENFEAVALIESGVFLDDIFAIISKVPYYSHTSYKMPIYYSYNKQQYEQNSMSTLYDSLAGDQKHQLLIDNPEHHHWDFATEGTIAAKLLGNREQSHIRNQAIEIGLIHSSLLEFFNNYLKHTAVTIPARRVLSGRG